MSNDYCGKCQNQGTKKCDGCWGRTLSEGTNWEPIKTPSENEPVPCPHCRSTNVGWDSEGRFSLAGCGPFYVWCLDCGLRGPDAEDQKEAYALWKALKEIKPIKTTWQQPTKELLEGDTRTEEEGKGYWWVLYKGDVFHYNAIHHLEFIRITMAEGPEINGLVYFNTITGTVYFDSEDIKIQPAPAPPKLEE